MAQPPVEQSRQALAPEVGAQMMGAVGTAQQALQEGTKPTPEMLASEKEAMGGLAHGAEMMSKLDLSKEEANLNDLMEGSHIPGTDRAVEDTVLATLIPSLRQSVEFQQRFRQNVINHLAERGDKYTFAAPQAFDLLMNVTGDNTAAMTHAVNVLGMYEGSRRRDRLQLYDKQVNELYAGYEQMRNAVDAGVEAGTINVPTATKMLVSIDGKYEKLLGSTFKARAATRAVLTTLLGEKAVQSTNDLEGRKQMMGAFRKQAQNALSQVSRSLSAAALAKGSAAQNLEAMYQASDAAVNLDPEQMKRDGFTDPMSYRLWLMAVAALGNTEPVLQMRSILQAKNPRAAVVEAMKNSRITPEEVYGTALGLHEALQLMLKQSDAARVGGEANPLGRGLTRAEFLSLSRRLLPFITEPAMTAHVNTAGALTTIFGSLYHAPKDVRDLGDDATGDTVADLATLRQLLGVYSQVSPAAETLIESMPQGRDVLTINALGKLKASIARQYGNIDEMDELTAPPAPARLTTQLPMQDLVQE